MRLFTRFRPKQYFVVRSYRSGPLSTSVSNLYGPFNNFGEASDWITAREDRNDAWVSYEWVRLQGYR